MNKKQVLKIIGCRANAHIHWLDADILAGVVADNLAHSGTEPSPELVAAIWRKIQDDLFLDWVDQCVDIIGEAIAEFESEV